MRKLAFAFVGIGLSAAGDYLRNKNLKTAAKVIDAIGQVIAIIGGLK